MSAKKVPHSPLHCTYPQTETCRLNRATVPSAELVTSSENKKKSLLSMSHHGIAFFGHSTPPPAIALGLIYIKRRDRKEAAPFNMPSHTYCSRLTLGSGSLLQGEVSRTHSSLATTLPFGLTPGCLLLPLLHPPCSMSKALNPDTQLQN